MIWKIPFFPAQNRAPRNLYNIYYNTSEYNNILNAIYSCISRQIIPAMLDLDVRLNDQIDASIAEAA